MKPDLFEQYDDQDTVGESVQQANGLCMCVSMLMCCELGPDVCTDVCNESCASCNNCNCGCGC